MPYQFGGKISLSQRRQKCFNQVLTRKFVFTTKEEHEDVDNEIYPSAGVTLPCPVMWIEDGINFDKTPTGAPFPEVYYQKIEILECENDLSVYFLPNGGYTLVEDTDPTVCEEYQYCVFLDETATESQATGDCCSHACGPGEGGQQTCTPGCQAVDTFLKYCCADNWAHAGFGIPKKIDFEFGDYQRQNVLRLETLGLVRRGVSVVRLMDGETPLCAFFVISAGAGVPPSLKQIYSCNLAGTSGCFPGPCGCNDDDVPPGSDSWYILSNPNQALGITLSENWQPSPGFEGAGSSFVGYLRDQKFGFGLEHIGFYDFLSYCVPGGTDFSIDGCELTIGPETDYGQHIMMAVEINRQFNDPTYSPHDPYRIAQVLTAPSSDLFETGIITVRASELQNNVTSKITLTESDYELFDIQFKVVGDIDNRPATENDFDGFQSSILLRTLPVNGGGGAGGALNIFNDWDYIDIRFFGPTGDPVIEYGSGKGPYGTGCYTEQAIRLYTGSADIITIQDPRDPEVSIPRGGMRWSEDLPGDYTVKPIRDALFPFIKQNGIYDEIENDFNTNYNHFPANYIWASITQEGIKL